VRRISTMDGAWERVKAAEPPVGLIAPRRRSGPGVYLAPAQACGKSKVRLQTRLHC